MGLRCLLGHNFGNAEIEREREEDGNQVVVTVQEIKRCRRCDERLLISENKEVTSVDQLAEAADGTVDARALDTDDGRDSNDDSGPESSPASTASDSATIPDAEPERGFASDTADDSESVSTESGDSESDIPRDDDPVSAEPSGDAGTVTDASDEDAIILDDEPDNNQPDSTENSEPTMTADPLRQGQTEGTQAEPESAGLDLSGIEDGAETGADSQSDNGIILDSEPTADPDDQAPGEWPDNPDRENPPGDTDSSPPEDQRESVTEEFEPWPEQRGEDEGFSATPDAGDSAAVSSDTAIGLPTDDRQESAESTGAQTETEDTIPGQSATVDGEHDGVEKTEAGFVRSSLSDVTAESDGAAVEYLCPDCGHVERIQHSSMRAGDICPECQRGYITERGV